MTEVFADEIARPAPDQFFDGRALLYRGDCLEVLRELEESSIDSCVCDPPYHLTSTVKRFGSDSAAPCKVGKTGAYARASAGFMGKKWDGGDIAFQPLVWELVFRALKPGGHLLAFGGTRTYHRMACAIEDAGFEIRDQIGWAYGSGFPKSHDVSKGIDKAGGTSPRDQSTLLRARRERIGLSRDEVAAVVGCSASSVRDWEEGRARAVGRSVEWIIPCEEYRAKLADLLDYSSDERELIGVAADRRADGTVIGLGHSGELRRGGVTKNAAPWQGWGTALKPAWEPIVVARKPLEGTVAANVLKWGVGAINVDGCRVGAETRPHVVSDRRLEHNTYGPGLGGSRCDGETSIGRWPANLIHDGSEEVLAGFPNSKGQQGDVRGTEESHTGDDNTNCYGEYGRVPFTKRSDSGSAARFFYCAKANSIDRLGSKHPTVKPLDLMRYLVRLVTPPDGIVLDPFAGTGATGEAAYHEGMRFVLIEMEAEYQADIVKRMGLVSATKSERRAVASAAKEAA